jgi:hypothetical protein
MHVRVAVVAGAVMASALVMAQGQQRLARGTATVDIGGKKVSIDYGRPQLKGRALGDLMKQLPADRIWRAGSGAVTTFATAADLLIGGKRVPAGKYSLYVHCPETGNYAVVLNSDLGQPLGKIWAAAPPNRANEPYPHFDYSKEIGAKEVVRAALTKSSVPATDLLTYAFKSSGSGATLTLTWGDQAWSLEIQPAK